METGLPSENNATGKFVVRPQRVSVFEPVDKMPAMITPWKELQQL